MKKFLKILFSGFWLSFCFAQLTINYKNYDILDFSIFLGFVIAPFALYYVYVKIKNKNIKLTEGTEFNKWYKSILFFCCFSIFIPILPAIVALIVILIDGKKFINYFNSSDRIFEIDNYYSEKQREIENLENKKLRILSELNSLSKNTVTQSTDTEDNKKDDEIVHSSEYNVNEISSAIKSCEQKKKNLEAEIKKLQDQRKDLKNSIKELTGESIVASTNVLYIDPNITSEEYKNKLSVLKLKISNFIKGNFAVIKLYYPMDKKSFVNNSKEIIRCFEAESNTILNSVTTKNIDTKRNQLVKAFETINKLFKLDGVELSNGYLELKLEELNIIYSYQYKKELEKEQQKAIKEQMIEEEKVRKEIEREKAKIEKEEKQFKNEVSKLMSYLQKASDIEKQLYLDKIKELEDKIKQLEIDKKDVLNRENNTRAGFVYVISNIGSFGENIYKIGMTRRLEPMDRVKELSSASVPFEFDVHAMIFSDDAPALESILHNTFNDKRVNKVNTRKEFFNVSLSEIEKVVKENHNATVEFTEIAKAEQYRESLNMSNNNTVITNDNISYISTKWGNYPEPENYKVNLKYGLPESC